MHGDFVAALRGVKSGVGHMPAGGNAPPKLVFLVSQAEAGAKWINLFDVSAAIQYEHQNLTDAYIEGMIASLAPTVENATALGIVDSLYVYGFDEISYAQKQSVYRVFGAIKRRWPKLRTVAALDWPEMPTDLPVDVWVDMHSAGLLLQARLRGCVGRGGVKGSLPKMRANNHTISCLKSLVFEPILSRPLILIRLLCLGHPPGMVPGKCGIPGLC